MAGQHDLEDAAAPVRILHLGASGRLGRLVSAAWGRGPGLDVLAQWRRPAEAPPGALLWSLLDGPVPDVGPVDVVVDLTGAVQGRDLSLNTCLAAAALEAADRLGARWTLLPSSGAVYGRGPFDADPPEPVSDYGRAKLEVERLARGRAATCLRIGNVAGADALLRPPPGPRRIDRLPDGCGPRRAYIGPAGLARVIAGLARLAARGAALPPVLDVAAPGVVGMEALAEAAGLPWSHVPAPEGVIAEVALDTRPLEALLPGAAGPPDPAAMVAEWRELAGGRG